MTPTLESEAMMEETHARRPSYESWGIPPEPAQEFEYGGAPAVAPPAPPAPPPPAQVWCCGSPRVVRSRLTRQCSSWAKARRFMC